MLKITIPKPCHGDWETMTPNQQGRHCNACAKTVVDFTLLSDAEVQQFFLHQKEKRVCGRFKQEQLHRIIITLPTNILHITMPRWKQFLTACLLAFSSMLFSCDTLIDKLIKGEPVAETEGAIVGALMVPVPAKIDTTVASVDTVINCTTLKGDTIIVEAETMGIISVPIEMDFIQQDSSGIKTNDEEVYFAGEIALDSNLISPIKPIDSVQIKNPPTADSTDCNNMKYY